jgi:hypothetical protein
MEQLAFADTVPETDTIRSSTSPILIALDEPVRVKEPEILPLLSNAPECDKLLPAPIVTLLFDEIVIEPVCVIFEPTVTWWSIVTSPDEGGTIPPTQVEPVDHGPFCAVIKDPPTGPGSLTVADLVVIQPFPSVTVTE